MSLEEMLQEYSKYGIYYTIVPFIEEVHILCEKKTSGIIDSIIQTLPDAEFIQVIVANYHTEMLQSYELAKAMGIKPEKKAWLFALEKSRVEIYSAVWESYDTTLLPNIANSLMKNVGLWIPGLYANKVDKSFLYKLNRFSLDAIDKAIYYHRTHYTADRWLPDIISEQIHIMVGELAAHYYLGIEQAQYEFFHMNVCEFGQLLGTELKERLFSRDGMHYPYFEYNEEWVQALEKLCEMAESWFGSKKPISTDTLMFHIPLLYQLINQEETAERKLMFQLKKNRKIYTVGPLMSCTIALAKTRDDAIRDRICSYLEELYSINRNGEYVKKYLSLLDETIDFFNTYFDHIRNYISLQNGEWRLFRLNQMKKHIELSGQISGDMSFLWIYQNLIENDIFINSLRVCKAKIQESINPLIDAEQFFLQSLNLFYHVSSHMDKCPRIAGNQLLVSLGQGRLSNHHYEVLYNVDFYDDIRHQALYDRFQTIQYELPSKEFTCWAGEIIKEFCQGDTIITKELISACSKISDNPIDYLSFDENGINREIRNLLEASLKHYGYSICDQRQQGLGNTGKKPGELDILIQKAGLPIAIYEGLFHRGNDYLKSHIKKAITRYNYSGCKKVYIVEFMRRGCFRNNWESSMSTIRGCPEISINETNTGLNGIKMSEGTFQWGDRDTGKMVFIGVNCETPD